MKSYSLRKSRKLLRQTTHLFLKKQKKLSLDVCALLRQALLDLQSAVMDKQREAASKRAVALEALSALHLRRTLWDQLKDLSWTLSFALVVAVVVRQMVFEFYEIPSGSMRPTLKELDRLAVSKTSFGINIPLKPKEFYFDPDLVQRNSIVIFTGENMDIRDVDTLYFYLFPGKKQYVKRLIGKPGDILYFYGGEIFGIDAQGNDLTHELQRETLSHIDHIPFIDFDRKLVLPPHPVNGVYSPVFIYQMNEPVVKLIASSPHRAYGEMMPLGTPIRSYGDLWGFGNFATARLLTPTQADRLKPEVPAELYLELRHSPSLENISIIHDEWGRLRPSIGLSTSIIPLDQEHLETLFHNLYTARFIVKQGKAYRYGAHESPYSPTLSGVPDGCYEFYAGVASEVLFEGLTRTLPLDHPLYTKTPERIQLLFNLGIEWDTRFAPQAAHKRLIPSRYAYFRNRDLYVMGGPLFQATEAPLQAFVKREETRAHPFQDRGPPLTPDGALDRALIRHYGLAVPEGMYLVLGDNHAMSADSREFGFVPASNLRGSPDLIFWPPGPRFGLPNQVAYPFMNLPRAVVWALVAAGLCGAWWYWRKRNRLPLL